MCTKNYDQMIYSSRDTVCSKQTDGWTDRQMDRKSDIQRCVSHLKMKCKITYRFSKTLENTYEGVQFSEVAGL